ncbi:MAG: hypothetical protein IT329_19010 [Caldilineaceae bacterium]|nr:hypothetical protein [Caldilineaceae bacterium]
MELIEFTRLQDDEQGIVATAEVRGRTALVKVLRQGSGSQVSVQVAGERVAAWEVDEPPNAAILEQAQTVAVRYLQ